MIFEVNVEKSRILIIFFGINYNNRCLYSIEMLFRNSGFFCFFLILLLNFYILKGRERGNSICKLLKFF